jgi:hypothetical protein
LRNLTKIRAFFNESDARFGTTPGVEFDKRALGACNNRNADVAVKWLGQPRGRVIETEWIKAWKRPSNL